MTKKLPTTILLITIILGLMPLHIVHADNPPVLITEVQTGFIDGSGTEFPLQEFIELTNVSPGTVKMDDWRIEYLSANNTGPLATASVAFLTGYLALNGHILISHVGYNPAIPDVVFGQGDVSTSGFLAKSGGHVRILNGDTVVDCVAWGSAATIAGCDKVSAVAPAGYTLQRKAVNGFYDKATGVSNVSPPTPQGGNMYEVDPSSLTNSPAGQPGHDTSNSTTLQTCDNVEITEILPNPAGDDAAGEFIEVHNQANNLQTLAGCTLRLANGKLYDFVTGASLQAQEYMAFPYTTTNLQLSNSGTSVTLVTATHEQTVSYPSLGDNQAWVWFEGVWQKSTEPTPGRANVLAGSDETDASSEVSSSVDASGAAVCPEGKERNTVTNRCRTIVVAATASPACDVGQERNPATNRCRKVVIAESTQKSCDPGQERNPDTNRCRKAEAPGKVLAASNTKPKSKIHLLLVVAAIVLALGYAVYEYRNDALNKFRQLRTRLRKNSKPN